MTGGVPHDRGGSECTLVRDRQTDSETERKVLRDMKQDTEFFADEVPLACTLTEAEKVTREEEVVDLFKHVLQVNELPYCAKHSDVVR